MKPISRRSWVLADPEKDTVRSVLIQAGVTGFIPAVLIHLGLQGLAAAGPPPDPFPDPSDKPKLVETLPNPGELAVRRVAAAMRSRPHYPATESAVEFALYLYAVSRAETDLEMARRLAEELEDSPGVRRVRSRLARAGGEAGDGEGPPLEFKLETDNMADRLEVLEIAVAAAMFSGSPEIIGKATHLARVLVEEISEAEDPRLDASVLEYCKAARRVWEMGFITGHDTWKKTAKRMLAAVLTEALESETIAPAAALAAARMETYPVQMVLIGSADDPDLRELRQASYRLFEPRKLLLNLDPIVDATRLEELFYPVELAPVLFICVESICSPPINTAEGLEARVREILDVASGIPE